MKRSGANNSADKGGAGEDEWENKNPLWLKDKGDEFFRNKDYYSAQNAYQQAHRLDPNLVQCLANRSAVHLCLYNFEECIHDAQSVLDWIEKQKKDAAAATADGAQATAVGEKYASLAIKMRLRKAIGMSWRGQVDE